LTTGPTPAGSSALDRLPIGVSIRTIRATPDWWLDSARRLDKAGYGGIWAWDHFVGKGDRTVPVVECWTVLSAAAAITRGVTVGSFVINVMNRHPAVLARMATTLQTISAGRLVLGIGIGGHPAEHRALGIAFPDAAERVARMEETIAVLRAIWSGGPVTRPSPFYPLDDAVVSVGPYPPPPIVIGAETARGAQIAARAGDGWTAFERQFEAHLPAYLEALAEAGRDRADQRLYVSFEGTDWLSDERLAESDWLRSPRETWARWRELGADGAIVTVRTTEDVDALVRAADRW
jgi:alkanesulfonate monooxygenase SsuD/methylene tetrahydromethanopterin reductase-like flavin-dependent oxidoreductase (luciferase family)